MVVATIIITFATEYLIEKACVSTAEYGFQSVVSRYKKKRIEKLVEGRFTGIVEANEVDPETKSIIDDKANKDVMMASIFAPVFQQDILYLLKADGRLQEDSRKQIGHLITEARKIVWSDKDFLEIVNDIQFREKVSDDLRRIDNQIEELSQQVAAVKEIARPFRIYDSYPEPTANFTGRMEELDAISDYLESHRSVFVSGIGGIGKSEICKQYIQILKSREPDTIVVWLYYDGSIMNTVNKMRVDGLEDSNYRDDEILFSSKMDVISDYASDPGILLVIDNYEYRFDPDFDTLGNCACRKLFTTRDDLPMNFCTVRISEMSPEKTFELVWNTLTVERRKSFTDEARKDLGNLLESVGYHTMMATLIAGLINKGDVKTTSESIFNLHTSMLVYKDGIAIGESLKSCIGNLFGISNLGVHADEILRLVSTMPRGGIDVEILYSLAGRDWDVAPICEELDARRWISIDCLEGKRRVVMHPLLSEYFSHTLKPSLKSYFCRSFADWLYQSIVKGIGEGRPKDLYLLRRYYSAAIYLMDNKSYSAWLYSTMSIAEQNCSKFQDAIRYGEMALELFKRNMILASKHVAKLHNSMGISYYEMGDLEHSRLCFRRALSVWDCITDKVYSDIGNIYISMGASYEFECRYQDAMDCYNKALEIYSQGLPEGDVHFAYVYNNMSSLSFAMGNYAEGRRFIDLASRCSANDSQEKVESTVKFNQSIYESLDGHAEESERLMSESIEAAKEIYHEGHPDLVRLRSYVDAISNNVADSLEVMAAIGEAVKLNKELTSSQSTDLKAIAESEVLIGNLLCKIESVDKAIPRFIKALEYYDSLKGLPMDKAYVYGNLSTAYFGKDVFTSMDYADKALEIYRQYDVPEGWGHAQSYLQLALGYEKLKNHGKSLKNSMNALRIWDSLSFPNPWLEVSVCRAIVEASMGLGDYKMCSEYCDRLVLSLERLSASSTDLKEAYEMALKVNKKTGDKPKVILYKERLRMIKKENDLIEMFS